MNDAKAVDEAIERIDHFGFCEDDCTFMLTCETADGRTLIVSACPGAPLSVRIDGKPTPKLRCLH